eukprot:312010-Lingulodinium_polyedra.AAC.1
MSAVASADDCVVGLCRARGFSGSPAPTQRPRQRRERCASFCQHPRSIADSPRQSSASIQA